MEKVKKMDIVYISFGIMCLNVLRFEGWLPVIIISPKLINGVFCSNLQGLWTASGLTAMRSGINVL